jgi:hypothetical protein
VTGGNSPEVSEAQFYGSVSQHAARATEDVPLVLSTPQVNKDVLARSNHSLDLYTCAHHCSPASHLRLTLTHLSSPSIAYKAGLAHVVGH